VRARRGRATPRPLIVELVLAFAILALAWASLVLALIVSGRKGAAGELATFLPNLALLFRGLAADERVPRRAKIALVVGALYLAMPIDIIPDFIPVAGQADDAIVAAAVLRFVLGSTKRAVLYAHWRGDPRTLDRLLTLARA
jgi:uncharacterized membrane protein YkvA (DUF1232 family)